MIIIEEKSYIRRKNRINFINWLVSMIGNALILITISVLFPKTLVIDNSFFGIWALIAAILISLLNITIKPVIVWLTLPITFVTLGLFYPFINVLILKIVSVILGSHFTVNGFLMTFIVAILISILNITMDRLIVRPILGKE